MDKTGLAAILLPVALCLPCLLVVLGIVGGSALVTGALASIAGSAVIAAGGLLAAVVLGGAVVVSLRRYTAACVADAEARRPERR